MKQLIHQCKFNFTNSIITEVDTTVLNDKDIFVKDPDSFTEAFVTGINNNPGSIQDKSFYRYPKLTLPRQKVDILKEKYNIKIIRAEEKADYKIISKKYITDFIGYNYRAVCKVEEVLSFLHNCKTSFTKDSYQEYEDFLQDKQNDYIVNGHYYSHNHKNTFLQGLSDISIYNTHHISESNFAVIDKINAEKNYIYENLLSDIIYEDLHVLTHEEYINAKAMIKSGDDDNLNLVMELLSNCNVNKSFDYVSMLFYFYYDIIKYSKNWGSVNVKTLRKTLDDFASPYNNKNKGVYYNRYLTLLKKHGFLTEFAIKECSGYIYHNVIKFHVNIQEDSILTINKASVKLNENQKGYVLTKED